MSVSIKKLSDDVFEVTVAKTSTTTHTVTVTDQSLSDLSDSNVTKTQLLEFSFRFLLEREPNTSILSSFDINVISRYFSDYKDEVMAKASSNLREAAARGGQIILITEERGVSEVDFADAVITVPNVDPLLAPILLAVPAQILAYLTAVEKGTDVDQPRNLAKSVTVE